jgi:hypothetical protein
MRRKTVPRHGCKGQFRNVPTTISNNRSPQAAIVAGRKEEQEERVRH